ncbi:FAD-dependent monooxygenase [Aquincola sp. MAHUQ-54]|uniref:FAD-dependent monooxygenase n=2 Tax=Sphaerotilaceae TaxID=2975441 RepID=A0AAW9QI85_9BURK
MNASNPDRQVDVCVRGAGAVGGSLALALSRQGLRVVLQQGPAHGHGPDVRAYALNAASVSLLRSLRVWDALPADAVTPVHDMKVEGDAAPGALSFSAWEQSVEALAWIVDAAALEEALDAALRFAPHVRRVGLDQPVDAPLTALCEGKHSATRQRLGIDFDLHWYGQRAIAARLVADRPHHGTARQWFRSPDILALLPFERPQAGASYGLVWSLPEARAAEMMAFDAAAFEQALNEATGGAAGRLVLGSDRAAWPLGLGRASRFSGPGWVLLGDSAHVVHPLAGQGLNLGLADVQALVETLSSREPWRGLGDERLLARYARRRLGPTTAMATVTDGLLHLFAPPTPWLRELRNRGLSLVDHLPGAKRWLAGRALGL